MPSAIRTDSHQQRWGSVGRALEGATLLSLKSQVRIRTHLVERLRASPENVAVVRRSLTDCASPHGLDVSSGHSRAISCWGCNQGLQFFGMPGR